MTEGTTSDDQFAHFARTLKEALVDAPGAPPKSTRQLVLAYRRDLAKLKHANGWTYKDLSAYLAKQGKVVSASQLRQYMTLKGAEAHKSVMMFKRRMDRESERSIGDRPGHEDKDTDDTAPPPFR